MTNHLNTLLILSLAASFSLTACGDFDEGSQELNEEDLFLVPTTETRYFLVQLTGNLTLTLWLFSIIPNMKEHLKLIVLG